MATTGVRELKARLSEYLRRASAGERVTITDRGVPIALIGPPDGGPAFDQINAIIATGKARWSGGKPRGISRPVRLPAAKSLSKAILEDRR